MTKKKEDLQMGLENDEKLMFTDHSQGQWEQTPQSSLCPCKCPFVLKPDGTYSHTFSLLNRHEDDCIRSTTNWNWGNYHSPWKPLGPGSAASPKPWWWDKKQSSKGAAGLIKNKHVMSSCYRESKGQEPCLTHRGIVFNLPFPKAVKFPGLSPAFWP